MEATDNKQFVYTRTSPFHLRFLTFFVILFMFAIIPLVVLMSTKRTNESSHAAPSTTILVTSPLKEVPVGGKIPISIVMDPGSNLVSVVKLILSYDNTKISTTSGFTLNTAAFPVTLTTPVNTCDGTICHISIIASIGANPTKIIQTKTTIGTIQFTALAPTNHTEVDVDSATQVLSTDPSGQPNQNVLSTTNPLTLVITDNTTVPTPMACGGFIKNPPQCPTGYYCDHTGINSDLPGKCSALSPTPQITCIPRPPCLDAVPRCTIPQPANGWCPVSPTPSGTGESFASISLASPNIDASSQLTHPTRSVTIQLYNIQTKQSYTAVDTVKFNGKNSFINDHFDLGTIPSGTYQLLLTMPQHLKKLLTQADNTNIFPIQPGNTIIVPQTQLVIGDIAPIPGKDDQPFGDNVLDIADYNQLISCYGDKHEHCSDVGRLAADLNDDGTVDAIDYNILLRSFAIREGDTSPFANSVSPSPSLAAPTPTPILLTVTPTCIVRPWCLDHVPFCRIAEPAGGWCPAPYVHVIKPPNGAVFNGNMQIPVQVTAGEQNGTVAKINLYLDNNTIPFATVPPGAPQIATADMSGYHHDDCVSHPITITATAIDTNGNTNSDKINITWNDTCPPSPSISQ